MSQEGTVRIGIIGAGGIARQHARYYKQVPWVEIVGVADVVPGKAREFVEALELPGARIFESHREMLETVLPDGVSVCTHNMAHRAPTVDALQTGVHVLLEKPMAAALEDARAIMRACDASDRILMVGFQPDFSSQYRAAKQIVESGTLGHIYYAESIAFRRWGIPPLRFLQKDVAGAGAVVDIGVYALHTTLSLMGDPTPVSVSAITANHLAKAATGEQGRGPRRWRAEDVEVEEFAVAFIRFANGAAVTFKVCWAANADSLGRPVFLGTKGGMALNPLEVYVNQQIGALNLTSTVQGLPQVDVWTEKIRLFAEAVRDGKPSPIDPHGVFLTNVVMDGVFRSAALGREVEVDASY